MYSYFITPPDFIDNGLLTITLINGDDNDVELMYHCCKVMEKPINVYLYKDEMDNTTWLHQAISKSSTIILNDTDEKFHNLLSKENTLYYGDKTYVCLARKINGIKDYFSSLQT